MNSSDQFLSILEVAPVHYQKTNEAFIELFVLRMVTTLQLRCFAVSWNFHLVEKFEE